MKYAPLVLFAYKRLGHLKRCVESLLANPEAAECSLTVYSDAPAGEEDMPLVAEVREYLRTISGFARVEVVEQEYHRGLAASVICGIDRALTECDRVVAVEDDLEVSPHFLHYMFEALELYRDDVQVMEIHGFTPVDGSACGETMFLRGADCWGWGTWRRAWHNFEPDSLKLLARFNCRSRREFDLDGAFPYYRMLEAQATGKIDSWAVRWHASAFLAGGLTLYPARSLVRNTGFDGSGTHRGANWEGMAELAAKPVSVARIPVAESECFRRLMIKYYRQQRGSLPRRIIRRIWHILFG